MAPPPGIVLMATVNWRMERVLKRAAPALILVLSCCIAAGAGSLSRAFAAAGAGPPQSSITIQQIFHQEHLLAQPPQDMAWSPDGTRLVYINSQGELMQVEGATGSRKVLVGREKMRSLTGAAISERERADRARYHLPSFLWVPDSEHLLFDANGQLWFFDVSTGTGIEVAIADSGGGANPQFSPNGAYLTYVSDHNLYLRRLPNANPAIQLTKSSSDAVLNGAVDWVYKEELDVRSNYFWSPDSKHLAYLQMDESQVPEYPIVNWLSTHASVDLQYYPQPGDPNPRVRVGVIGPNGGKTKWIDIPIDSGDDYIPRFGWVNKKTLWIESLTRDQKKRTLYFADIETGDVSEVLTQTDAKFLNASYDVTLLPGEILLTGWQDGHNHIYLYRFNAADPLPAKATFVRQLGSGSWEVSKICAVGQATQTLYYLSNEGDPRQQQIWAIKLDGTGKHRVSTTGSWHDPTFSPNAKFFADTISSVATPPVVDLCSHESSCRTLWKAAPLGVDLIAPIPLELKASDGATTLYGELVMPPAKTAAHSVPLILSPYGGPDVQKVTGRWNALTLLFDQVLAERGFAVLHVDNRGMAGRGRDFAQAAYHDFGQVQLGDQIAALDQVLTRYPQLDGQRLGCWGWSWGGTLTLYAMTHSSRFRAGAAIAPVTDWRNYDSIYTERYMGPPARDNDGYREDSVVNSAANLKGRLFLAQGTGDRNVHVGNSIQFIARLVDAGIAYDLQLYPGKSHDIYDASARTHLYSAILAHFERYLAEPPGGDASAAGRIAMAAPRSDIGAGRTN